MCGPGCPCPGRAGRADRRPALVKRLKDGDLPVRLQAVIALGRLGQRRRDTRDFAARGATKTSSSPIAPARPCDESTTGRVAAQGLDSPDPKVRSGTLLAMDQVSRRCCLEPTARTSLRPSSGPSTNGLKAVEYLAEVDRKPPPGMASGGARSRPSKSDRPGRSPGRERRTSSPRFATCRRVIRRPSPDRGGRGDRGSTDDSRSFLRGLYPLEQDPGVQSAIARASESWLTATRWTC